ncbi:MAG: hypothetical protein KatS3mg061_0246 [Dehalococcoidia bacterium]|nr:MAG: hypothetical protein KatS3mg061_0246 [Dehalococcoidia bacterium]
MARPALSWLLLALIISAPGCLAEALQDLAPVRATTAVEQVFIFPDLPLATVQNRVLPGSIGNDRRILLGGVGSDLWHDPGAPRMRFWMTTDRGPNGQVRVEGENRRTFPVPEFDPLILEVTLVGQEVRIEQVIPLRGRSGRPVSGLPNREGADETPWDYRGRERLPFNQSGIDPEGLVRTSRGEFWLAEEYSPSLLQVSAEGVVQRRLVPQGVKLPQADYLVEETLPAIYARRKSNRGFEGLAISRDEQTLYLALQSPLSNPTRAVGEQSRQTRILAVDARSGLPVGEWIYRFDPAGEFARGAIPDDMKLSALVWLNATTLLVLERTDEVAKLYLVDLSQATNILGSRWDDPATTPSLEALADPAEAGIQVLPKRLLVDLSRLPEMPGKIEGVAVVDAQTLAIANDNDFDIGEFDAAGNNQGKGVKSQVLLVRLAQPLPLAW